MRLTYGCYPVCYPGAPNDIADCAVRVAGRVLDLNEIVGEFEVVNGSPGPAVPSLSLRRQWPLQFVACGMSIILNIRSFDQSRGGRGQVWLARGRRATV